MNTTSTPRTVPGSTLKKSSRKDGAIRLSKANSVLFLENIITNNVQAVGLKLIYMLLAVTYNFDVLSVFFSAPFYKIMVPTVDTVRYDFLIDALITHGKPVLICGPVGTGKTSVADSVLSKLDSSKYSSLILNMSSQVNLSEFLIHTT